MNVFIVLPIIVPFITAIILLILWNRPHLQRILSVVGALGLLLSGLGLMNSVMRQGVQAAWIGNWPAPFGITLAADLLSAIMVVMVGLMGSAVAIYSLATIDDDRAAYGYFPLLHILFMGICGSFVTGDVFNLYVWFEVMLIASFVLLALGGERGQLEGTLKYVTLNLLSSVIFLTAIGLLYGTLGTLNMADLAVQARASDNPAFLTVIAMLFLVGFGIKAAVFPVFAWLPASYHTPPAAVSAIFAGLLTKVGVYALLRVFSLIFVQNTAYTHGIILIIAGLTMVLGIIAALGQTDMRRVLSFNLISHIGFMLMGLGLFTPIAVGGAIFYIVHDITVKTTLFMVSGVVRRLRGTEHLPALGGLYRQSPVLAALFLIPALALSGVPPLSGFWPKLALIQEGLGLGQYLIVGAALLASLLTLYSMTSVWSEAFWKDAPTETNPDGPTGLPASILMPIATLVTVTVFLGLFAEPVFGLSVQAAGQLLDPTAYINAVLGG